MHRIRQPAFFTRTDRRNTLVLEPGGLDLFYRTHRTCTACSATDEGTYEVIVYSPTRRFGAAGSPDRIRPGPASSTGRVYQSTAWNDMLRRLQRTGRGHRLARQASRCYCIDAARADWTPCQ